MGGGIDDWKFFLFVGVANGWIFFWLRIYLCNTRGKKKKRDLKGGVFK